MTNPEASTGPAQKSEIVQLFEANEVFTTGEAARICKLSQQSIIRCFDNKKLTGFTVPGSNHRRIPRMALARFMKANGIPVDASTSTTFELEYERFVNPALYALGLVEE